jgi:Neuraminidase (sialidase)
VSSNQWTTWHSNELQSKIEQYCNQFNETKNQLANKALRHFAFNYSEYWQDWEQSVYVLTQLLSPCIDRKWVKSDERLAGIGLINRKSIDEGNALGANVSEEVNDKLYQAKEMLSDKLNRQVSKACMMRTALMHYMRLSGHQLPTTKVEGL